MKKLYLLYLFVLCSIAVSGQNTLKGKVTDANTNAPLVGANIKVPGGGTITDVNGDFSVPCNGPLEATISFIGYATVRRSVTDCASEISVALTATPEVLNAVEITATSAQNRSLLEQPVSIIKLGVPEIKRSIGLFLDDAINANVPGVFMNRRSVSGGQQFNIRGYGGGGPGNRGTNNNFDGLGVKTYLNGIPITDAEGITVMDDIDFGTIGNVEISKGPSGTLYGLAIAGVVNLQTIRPTTQRVQVGQEVLLGSYGLKRFTTSIQISQAKSSMIITYGKQKYDGFMPHTASTKDFVNIMGDFQLSDKQTLTAYTGWSDSYDERNGELTIAQFNADDFSGNPAYIKNNAHSNVISFRAGLAHNYQFSKNISNSTSFFGSGVSNNASSAGGWTDKTPTNYGLRSVFDTKFDLSSTVKLSGLTGIEAQKQLAQIIAYPMVTNNNDPAGYNIIGAIRSNQTTATQTYSVFTQWTLTLPQDISLTAGLGSSTMDITLMDKLYVAANNVAGNTVPRTYATSYKSLLSPTVSINKVFNKQMSVYASYNQGWRAPTAANIYTPLAGTANTGLRPEKGRQFEVGSKGTLLEEKLIYEVAFFSTKFTDKMTLVGVPNAAGTATLYSYAVNSGGLDNQGLELLVKYNAMQSPDGFVKMIRPWANYTYNDFKYNQLTFNNNVTVPTDNYNGKAVAGAAKNTFNTGVDFISNPGFYANITYLFRDPVPITPDGLNIAPAFGLLNGKIGYRKAIGSHYDLDVYFGAVNITGVKYYQMIFVNQLPDAYIPASQDINYFGGINFKYIF